MVFPQFTEYEARTRHTFKAMMWALSYPGRVSKLMHTGLSAFEDIADSLLDLETSYYCEDDDLLPALQRTGARQLPVDRAAYHFYPTLDDAQLDTVKSANIGTLIYPDQAATLVIGCKFGTGLRLKLEGPGIPPSDKMGIQVGDMPADFWQLREKAIRYPRGWDIYLIDGDVVIGLPRTTRITIEG